MLTRIYFLVLGFFLLAGFTDGYAQVPQKFNYQGIARDSNGNPIIKQTLGIKLSVLPTSDASVPEYEEIQTLTTNEFGLYTLQIGNGQAVAGTMQAVKWETGNKYIRVSIDPKGGTNYIDAGTTQLLSVPYAIYADKAGMAKETSGGSRAGNQHYLSKFDVSGSSSSEINSQLFDNGTNIGIGTTSPSAKVHVSQNVAAVQEHIRMQNLSATGAGRFTMYSDGASNYSTFTKYGSTYAGGYAGITTLYPYGNLLAFGNNGVAANDGLGRFLISSAGNIGISLFKGGTSKLKFHADYTSENVGIGGNSAPVSRVHLNNTDGTSMDVRLTHNTSGHTANDGLTITENGTTASINNQENGNLTLGTNNTTRMTITASGNVEVANQLKVSGGAPGAGKVLTSDANGLASWQTPASSANTWSTNGNSGLNSGINFLGTTDTVPLKFRVNNLPVGALDPSKRMIALGDSAAQNNTTGHSIIAIGNKALVNNTVGYRIIAIGDSALNRFSSTATYVSANVAIGYLSQYANDTGYSNTGVGYRTLQSNKSNFNTAVGAFSLRSNTSGYQNTALGGNALFTNTTGGANTGIGAYALVNNYTGNSNTAIGNMALRFNYEGNHNVAVGDSALLNNIDGGGNIAIGKRAMEDLSGGNLNIAIGHKAMKNAQYANELLAIGDSAMYSNTTGQYNMGIGHAALLENTDGNFNIAMGRNAMRQTPGDHNLAIGHEAMASIGPISGNIAIGDSALRKGNDNNNVAIGYRAMQEQGSASDNVGVGYNAMQKNNNGSYNTAVGSGVMQHNLYGSSNTAMGKDAMNANTSGEQNTAIGYSALQSNLTGIRNVAMGAYALMNHRVNDGNLALGTGTLLYDTSGSYNVAVGYYAANQSRNGENNISIGNTAGYNNLSGKKNISIGYRAAFNNTSVSGIIAIGDSALYDNGAAGFGTENIALGQGASRKNTSGIGNLAIGNQALYQNTTGNANVAIGNQALEKSTSSSNTAVGDEAARSTTTGFSNVSVGSLALASNTTSSANVSVGYRSLDSINSSVGGNTALGYQSGKNITTGGMLTLIGSDANAANNLTNATALGSDAYVSASHSLVLGSINGVNGSIYDTKVGIGVTNPDEKLTIGTGRLKFRAKDATMNGLVFTDSAGTLTRIQLGMNNNSMFSILSTLSGSSMHHLLSSGQWGLNKIPNIGATYGKLQIKQSGSENSISMEHSANTNHWDLYVSSNGNLMLYYNGTGKGSFDFNTGAYTATSDRRMKKDITLLESQLDKLRQLALYQFHYSDNASTAPFSLGVMAQEVKNVYPDAVVETENKEGGTNYSVNYQYLGVATMKAVQEQQEQIEALKKENEELKTQFEELKKLLQSRK